MLDPATPPPCPACGCRRVHRVLAERPPDQTTLEASIEISTGFRGMYDKPKNLITLIYCKQCGHDMTEIRKRVAALSPRQFERVHEAIK